MVCYNLQLLGYLSQQLSFTFFFVIVARGNRASPPVSSFFFLFFGSYAGEGSCAGNLREGEGGGRGAQGGRQSEGGGGEGMDPSERGARVDQPYRVVQSAKETPASCEKGHVGVM